MRELPTTEVQQLGRDVSDTIRDLCALATEHNERCFMVFNGMRIEADPGEPAADVLARWNETIAAEAEAWRASPEGQAVAAEQAQKENVARARGEEALRTLPALDATNPPAVLDWIDGYLRGTEVRGLPKHADHVRAAFEGLGFAERANEGAAFDTNDRENVFRWIVGQFMNGLGKPGGPPQVLHRVIAEWQGRWRNTPA